MQWTEEKIEDWLQRETRPLMLPGGRRVMHTTFRIVWQRYDGLRAVEEFTDGEIIACAVAAANLSGESFGDSFDWVVDYLEERRHTLGRRRTDCDPKKRDQP